MRVSAAAAALVVAFWPPRVEAQREADLERVRQEPEMQDAIEREHRAKRQSRADPVPIEGAEASPWDQVFLICQVRAGLVLIMLAERARERMDAHEAAHPEGGPDVAELPSENGWRLTPLEG